MADDIRTDTTVELTEEITFGGDTTDYSELSNKPKINSVELSGNKSLDDLSIQHKLVAGTGITIENNVISAQGGSGDAYTKAETDTLLSAKADKSTTYTKTETDTLLSNKANSSDVYAKSEIDTKLSAKADSEDIPTKTSELTNDSGFITNTYHDSTKQNTSSLETDVKTFINKAYIESIIDSADTEEY